MPSTDRGSWLAAVTHADLVLCGLAEIAEGKPAASALLDWAGNYSVDLHQVHDALQLLTQGPYLLYVPSPLALMVYSPTRQRFKASFDTATPPELEDLNLPAAGAWLTVLCAEVGALPIVPDHRFILRFDATGICGTNCVAADQYPQYPHIVPPDREQGSEGEYYNLEHQAIRSCVRYALQ